MALPLELLAGNGRPSGMQPVHRRYQTDDRSILSLIKNDIRRCPELSACTEQCRGRINIVLAELISNQLNHGLGTGEILWKPLLGAEAVLGVEIIAVDRGKGIANLSRALEDGYSTSGTAGEGLGAIKRQSDTFDIYSQKDVGTVVVSQVYSRPPSCRPRPGLQLGALAVALPGQLGCGDGYALQASGAKGHYLDVLLVDGLGHGPSAQEATHSLIKAYLAKPALLEKGQLLRHMHEQGGRHRGGVSMAVEFNSDQRQLRFCGVGNISAQVITRQGSKSLVTYNGIIGHTLPGSLQDQSLAWPPESIVILHTDGIKTRWKLTDYPRIWQQPASIIAACLYRDFLRGRDDAAVLVIK